MNINSKSLVGYVAAAIAAYAVLSAPVQADGRPVHVKIAVSLAGLDLGNPVDAQMLYILLKNAADSACGRADRVGLAPVADFSGCYERALGDAVRSIDQRQLTLAYLGSHTFQQASNYGIAVPAQVAAN